MTTLLARDVITAAVALDDGEWFAYATELMRCPKQDLADLLQTSFRGALLNSGLQAMEDVERSLRRLSELAGWVVQTPARARTVLEAALEPIDQGASATEKQAFENLIRSHAERFGSLKRFDKAAAIEMAAEFKRATPWRTEARRAAHSPGDAETVRALFGAFLQAFADCFDPTNWKGAHVPESSAYSILALVAFAPARDLRRTIIHPMLREVAGVLRDGAARSAVLLSLEEIEELDGVGAG